MLCDPPPPGQTASTLDLKSSRCCLTLGVVVVVVTTTTTTDQPSLQQSRQARPKRHFCTPLFLSSQFWCFLQTQTQREWANHREAQSGMCGGAVFFSGHWSLASSIPNFLEKKQSAKVRLLEFFPRTSDDSWARQEFLNLFLLHNRTLYIECLQKTTFQMS